MPTITITHHDEVTSQKRDGSTQRFTKRLALQTPIALKDTVKALPDSRWTGREGNPAFRWHVPATLEVAARLLRLGATNELRLDRRTLDLLKAARAADDARASKTATGLPDFGRTEAWEHQRQAFHFAVAQQAAMLAMDMGTGKSKVLVGLADAKGADLMIILAPPKAVRVWPPQFAAHSDRNWIAVNHGGYTNRGKLRKNPNMKQRVETMTAAIEQGAREGRPVALIVNYEAAWQGVMADFLLAAPAMAERLRPVGEDVVAGAGWDESQKIKSPSGKWSRFAARLREHVDFAYALTGTPNPHSAKDLFAQCRALDPGIFGTSFKKYRDRYFEMGGYEGREIVGWKNQAMEDEHTALFSRVAYICDSDDVLDLPAQQDLPPAVCKLGDDGAKIYRELETDFMTYIGDADLDDPVVAQNALSQLLRLAQVTSGHLPVERDGEKRVEQVDKSKFELLVDTLEDLPADEPLVVFGRFRHDLDMIATACERTGRSYGEISGRREDGFEVGPDGEQLPTMNPDVDVVGVQLQAGGVGIDLTRARYAIYYSLDFNLGDFSQSRKRVHRPGQDRPVFYIYLVAEGTVDEIILSALFKREEVTTALKHAAKDMAGALEEAARVLAETELVPA